MTNSAAGRGSRASVVESPATGGDFAVGERLLSVGVHGDWRSSASFVTAVEAGALWPILVEPSTWASWWHELECVRLHGPLGVGDRGVLRLRGLPPLPVRVRDATADFRLALQMGAGPLLMEVEFILLALPDGGTEITERVCIVGPGSALAGRLFDFCRGEHFALSITRLVSLAVVAAHANLILGQR